MLLQEAVMVFLSLSNTDADVDDTGSSTLEVSVARLCFSISATRAGDDAGGDACKHCTTYLRDFKQVGVLVDGDIAEVLASAQLTPDLREVVSQIGFSVLHPALSIIIPLVHTL